MKVSIVRKPYYDGTQIHYPGAGVTIAGAAAFSTVCMRPADQEAEAELVKAGKWPLDEDGRPPSALVPAPDLAAVRKEAELITANAKRAADECSQAARNSADNILLGARQQAEELGIAANAKATSIVSTAKAEADSIVAAAKKEADDIVAAAKTTSPKGGASQPAKS